MFHASMRLESTSAMAQARACSQILLARTSRRSADNFLESSRPTMRRFGSRITAAATTCPKREPRPTSSRPAILSQPHLRASRSYREEHRLLIAANSSTPEIRMSKQFVQVFVAPASRRRYKNAIESKRPSASRAGPFPKNFQFEILRLLFLAGRSIGSRHALVHTLQARGLALQPTQIIQLCAAHAALAQYLNGADGGRVGRKN